MRRFDAKMGKWAAMTAATVWSPTRFEVTDEFAELAVKVTFIEQSL
jgi:hypothetical protein